MKFKLTTGKGSVHSFRGPDGKVYHPGDVVELPASYKGEKWLECLERLEPEKKVAAAPSKVEPAPETKPEVPLSELKKAKKAK